MKITNWVLTRRGIVGETQGHPTLPDGSLVLIHKVSAIDEEGRLWLMNGWVFELGKPEPKYERKYPNAREKALAAIRNLIRLKAINEPVR